MNILMVAPYFFPAWSYGGIPRIAYGLSRGLQKRGHRISVVTTDAHEQHARTPWGVDDVGGIAVHRFPNLSNRLAYAHQAFMPVGMAGFFTAAPAHDYDVVHVHGHRHLPGVLAARWAKASDTPLILHPNGTLPAIERKLGVKRVFDRLIGDTVVADASHHIAVSRAEVNQMRRHGIPASRISVVPNGLDLNEFEALPPKGTFKTAHGLQGRRIILYLGKLTPRKGVDHLIEAFGGLAAPDVTLVVAGNDMTGLMPKLQRQVQGLGLADRVRFVGLIQGDMRLAALADAAVLAYPSTQEIFGLVPFEGLLAGAPVVVGDDCGCGELVQAAGAGLLVRYGDSAALRSALRRLLNNEPDRLARVHRGRAWIKQNLSWRRVAAMTEAVYQKTLDKP